VVDAFQLHGTVKLKGAQQVNELPAFDVNRKIVTVLTRTCAFSLFWAGWIQSRPSQLISWRSIFILFTHLCL